MSQATEKYFPPCPLSGWHAWEGGSIRTLKFELTHGRKTRGTHFPHTDMGQRLDWSFGRNVVLPHDPPRLSSQSPAGPGYILGFEIRPCLGAINCAPE